MAATRTWPIRRWLLRQADALVVTNKETGGALKDVGIEGPAYCLSNGVDVQRFRPLGPDERLVLRKTRSDELYPLDLSPESLVAIYACRMVPIKRIDVLLRAWARLVDRETGRDLVLVLVGDGPERRPLGLLSRELGIASSVRFVGQSEYISDWLNSADLFVRSSSSEGLSNALLEAMACGLPVVATAVGGAPEVIEDGVNGLLVPAGDDIALARALMRLVDDVELAVRLGKAARQTILASYSMEAVVDRYIDLYTALTGDRRSHRA
jgi:glycosyltransferase involved in cell wall biosynthesis